MLTRRPAARSRLAPPSRLRTVTGALAGSALVASTMLVVPAVAVLALPAPALAQGDTCETISGVVFCEPVVEDPANPGGGGNPGGGSGGGGGGCTFRGAPIPCQDDRYGWYVGDGCYMRVADPQPDVDPPDDAGPGGQWYARNCYTAYGPGASPGETLVWQEAGTVAPNPEELARRAMARIAMYPPAIGIAPDPAGTGLVGLPVWLWTEPGPGNEPQQESESEAGLTVTVEAVPVELEWNLGDGTVLFCDLPGTPYDPSFGGAPSPDCGHIYTRPSAGQPDGAYQISVRTRWQVTYSSNIDFSDFFTQHTGASTTALTINELQVVTS